MRIQIFVAKLLVFGTKNGRRLHGQRELICETKRKKDINIIRGQRAWSWLRGRRENNEKIENEETNNDAREGRFLQRIPTTDLDNRNCLTYAFTAALYRSCPTKAITFQTYWCNPFFDFSQPYNCDSYVPSMDASCLDMCDDKLKMKRFSTGQPVENIRSPWESWNEMTKRRRKILKRAWFYGFQVYSWHLINSFMRTHCILL